MKMWSGRFQQQPDAEFEQWQRSFPFDRILLPYEVAASKAHASALAKAGVLTGSELSATLAALEQIRPIAEKHRASFAQVVINWTIQEPGITAALVGARNAEQATHNAGAWKCALSADERATIRRVFDPVAKALGGTA